MRPDLRGTQESCLRRPLGRAGTTVVVAFWRPTGWPLSVQGTNSGTGGLNFSPWNSTLSVTRLLFVQLESVSGYCAARQHLLPPLLWVSVLLKTPALWVSITSDDSSVSLFLHPASFSLVMAPSSFMASLARPGTRPFAYARLPVNSVWTNRWGTSLRDVKSKLSSLFIKL